jgi:large subunit ribosomal protein L24
MKIIRGDNVLITAGKDKGKSGKVERVFPTASKVIVAGVNLYKKNLRSRRGVAQTGIVDIVKPISVASVQVICPKCNLPTRVGWEVSGKDKFRICKKCKQRL